MQVIIEHDQDVVPYLGQYADKIEVLDVNHKVLEIEERYLPWLKGLTTRIEPNFIVELGGNEDMIAKDLIDYSGIIWATISKGEYGQEADYIYDITAHTFKIISSHQQNDKCLWISCSNDSGKITAKDYIKCIADLKELSDEQHRPMLIYADITIPDEHYRCRGLTGKIINQYLEAIKGLMLIRCSQEDLSKCYSYSQESCVFYKDKVIYIKENLKDAVLKGLALFRQGGPLFENDVFYASIDPNEEIYAFLDIGNYRPLEYYEALGLRAVRLIGEYGMLYARKSQFDELSSILRPDITPRYRIPILSHVYCEREEGNQLIPYSLTEEDLRHKGRGVYIGLIAADDIDYTSAVLRDQNGGTRIAYIWQQVRADEGVQYFKEDIDRALVSPNPETMIPLPQGDSMSTMMLGIAGGKSAGDGYQGVATEAEFIVAKAKTASDTLQRIYGGMPSPYGVILQDMIVSALKLADFARERNRPLVLCMPFNTNIDPHDGSLILYEILGLVARRSGVTLVIPTGDEADKQHHYRTEQSGDSLSPLALQVARPNQNVVGVIYQRVASIITANLYPPEDIAGGPVDLRQPGVTALLGTTVYSNGERIDFLNGARRIFFRIENPHVGEWRLIGTAAAGELSSIYLWISQKELNPYITLRPSDAFTTLGSSACMDNAMVVGGYNQQSGVVLRSSGRGYTWDGRVRPTLVTGSRGITAPCRRGEWVSVTGTLPAASIMAGVAATIYSKLIAEGRVPLPNTLAINNILLEVISQSYGVTYPNPSEGYGVFDLRRLYILLDTPM